MNNDIITSQHILAIRVLKQRLGDFVKEAFHDEYNHQGLTIDLLLGRVSETVLFNLERVLYQEALARAKRPPHLAGSPELLSFAFAGYAAFLAGHAMRVISTVPPALVDLVPQERASAFLAELGVKHPELVRLDADGDLVVEAWNVARANRRRALQRFGALYYLASELMPGPSGDSEARLKREMTDASRYLLRRAADFQSTELKFAVLLGGQAQALTMADVAADSFSRETSILQYLNRDERVSGYEDGTKRQMFFEAIHGHAGAPQ